MEDRNEAVKELFENTGRYLKYDYNLRIRQETLEFFTRELRPENVLDMPCGNGEISMQLLNRTGNLVMMDVSRNMISLAKKNVPENFKHKVELINADFFKVDLTGQTFDLVICLGILAHVESPESLLTRISGLVKPGGYLVIQNTDAKHFYNYLIRFYLGAKNIFKRQSYRLNNFRGETLEVILAANGLVREKMFRYNQSFLGFSNLFSNERKYALTRRIFGSAEHPKNQSFGSDVTYLFKKAL
jgi:ubiquinone/menaquinone biosynthesis C-methylase UbiE